MRFNAKISPSKPTKVGSNNMNNNNNSLPAAIARKPHRSRLGLRRHSCSPPRVSKPGLPVSETSPSLGSPRPDRAARVDRDGMFHPAGDVHDGVKETAAAAAVGVCTKRFTRRQAEGHGVQERRDGAAVVGMDIIKRMTMWAKMRRDGGGEAGRGAVKEAFSQLLAMMFLLFFLFIR